MISLLTTSHLSIHTWPEKGAMSMDIFSCNARKLNKYKINNIIKKYFNTNTIFSKLVDREY